MALNQIKLSILLLLLWSCGGGSNSGNQETSSPETTPTVTETDQISLVLTFKDVSLEELSEYEKRKMIKLLINGVIFPST